MSDLLALAAEWGSCDVLVVDDGSSSDYVQKASSALGVTCLIHATNQGKGAALRTGFNHLLKSYDDSDLMGFIDADGDIPARSLFDLAAALVQNGSMVAVGSKRSSGTYSASAVRKMTSASFSRLASALMPTGLDDTQVGVKVFSPVFLRAVLPLTRTSGFLLDVELLAAAHRRSIQVVVRHVEVSLARNSSTINARHIFKMGKDLLLLSVRTLRGRTYKKGSTSAWF